MKAAAPGWGRRHTPRAWNSGNPHGDSEAATAASQTTWRQGLRPLTGRPGVRPLHRVQESGPSTGSPGVRPRPLHRESRAQVPPQGDQDSGPSTGSPAPARGKKSGLGRVQPVVRGCWEWACGCAHSSSGQWGANEGLSGESDVIRHFPGRVTLPVHG